MEARIIFHPCESIPHSKSSPTVLLLEQQQLVHRHAAYAAVLRARATVGRTCAVVAAAELGTAWDFLG